MSDLLRVYWDACAWLGLLNGEPAKRQALEAVWMKAESGELKIWTSAFCIAEVYKTKCEGESTGLLQEHDDKINNLFDQDFVVVVQVDSEIAKLAKKLLRTHPKLKKPSDGIHLATAVYWNLDQFHTYDEDNLLGLQVHLENGKALTICKPEMVDGPNLFNLTETVSADS